MCQAQAGCKLGVSVNRDTNEAISNKKNTHLCGSLHATCQPSGRVIPGPNTMLQGQV